MFVQKNVLRSDSYQFDETAIVIPGEGGVGDIFSLCGGQVCLTSKSVQNLHS